MSYRIRLFLTHIATAIVAGYCVWYGLQVDGYSQLAFMVLFGASVVVPNAVAAHWLNRGLQKMESSLGSVSDNVDSTGLAELDQVSDRLQQVLKRQRSLVRNVDELLARFGQNSSATSSGVAAGQETALTHLLGQLSRTTAQDTGCIMACGDDIARSAHDAGRSVQEQVRIVDDVISSVEQLAAVIDTVSSDAEAASGSARIVSQCADVGHDLIQQLVAGMEKVRTNVEYSEKKVLALGRQSEQISSIVETMGGLSARTDMLALNASIEAVRAGQEGRGFAVVAEEVRKLAESTSTASQSIAALVDTIQSEALDTVSTMTEERQQVQEEIRRIHDTGTALQEIRSASAESASRSQHISEAITDQLQHTQHIVTAMQKVSATADRISDGNESIRQRTTDLVEAAQEIEEALSPMYQCGEIEHRSGFESRPRRNRSNAHSPGELLDAVSRGEFAK